MMPIIRLRHLLVVVPRPHYRNPADLEHFCRTVRVKARLAC